jgi:tetratricopeptide (TPR) repeat protein
LSAAREHTKALERLAKEAQSLYTRGTSQLHQGILLLHSFELEAAMPALEEARKAFTESGGRVYAVAAAAYYGLCLLRKGEINQALSTLEENEKDMEKFHVKDPLVLLHASFAEALLARAKRQASDSKAKVKDLNAAYKQAELAIKSAKLFPVQLPTATRVMALIEWELGRPKEAKRLLAEGVSFAATKGMKLEEELLQLALDKELRGD